MSGGYRQFSHLCVGIIFQMPAYGESLFLFRDVKHDSVTRERVFMVVWLCRAIFVCMCVRMFWARTCLSRCPVDCWVAGRGGRCLCCGRFSCRSSSSHPPTQPTGPGYLQDRRCKTNVTEFDNTSQMCTHTHTDVYSLKQALFTNIQVFFKTEHFPGIWVWLHT